MKLSLSTLAEAQTTHRKTVSPRKMRRQIHSFCLPTTATPNTGSTMTLFYLMTLCLFLCFPVKTSSLSDHTSKVMANNGALSKLIHAQGMDWQWRISVSRLYKATQLFPLPCVHNQTSAIQCHRPINTAFVLAWHHCFVFIKISLLWHRHFFVLFPTKPCSSPLFVSTITLTHIWFFFSFPCAVALIHKYPLKT